MRATIRVRGDPARQRRLPPRGPPLILSGMSPVGDIAGVWGRVFASAYALFSGQVFVGVCRVLSAPQVHLFLHRFRADLDDAD